MASEAHDEEQDNESSPDEEAKAAQATRIMEELIKAKAQFKGRVDYFILGPGEEEFVVVHYVRGPVYKSYMKRFNEAQAKQDFEQMPLLDEELILNATTFPEGRALKELVFNEYAGSVAGIAGRILTLSGVGIAPVGKV